MLSSNSPPEATAGEDASSECAQGKEEAGGSAVKIKSKLTPSTVLEIFAARPKQQAASCRKGDNEALRIAKLHGVTEKAVRDIWRGRTWRLQTAELASAADVAATITASRRHGRASKERTVEDRQQNMSPPFVDQDPSPSCPLPLTSETLPTQQTKPDRSFPFDVIDVHQLPSVRDFDDPFRDDWPFWAEKNRKNAPSDPSNTRPPKK
mmetsp:Transcript_11177/g.31114  ORF Transcript_11177/g.31114 Transcript_11177/m.31114 type:complete len:208 (+) Transcript_11177:246-869(+)